MATTERLAELRTNLVASFSDEELRTLCFDLGVDPDGLPGRSRDDRARELLAYLDRVGRIPDLILYCAKARPNVAWREIAESADAPSPFKGLEFFDVRDAGLFFGREALTARLIGRLRDARTAPRGEAGWHFLAVVGASGSGKSSLARAGVVAALQSGEPLVDGALPPDCSTEWPIHILTPTAHPLKALAASLTGESESVTAQATLMDDLARDSRSLDLYAARLLAGGRTRRLLLLVDQFEELFTLCSSPTERKAFIDNLVTAAADEADGQVLVIITLRADFYDQCAPFEALRQLLQTRQEYIGAMTAGELCRAIEEPARRRGFDFEPGLLDTLILDAGNEPGALPLLSHALLETWKRREGRTLTLQGYADSGRLQGAIAKTADTTFGHLSPAEQAIARSIFLRLVAPGESTLDTRRRAALDEVIPTGPPQDASVRSVLIQLADARLVTMDEKSVDVAHEALIRNWPRLRQWLDEDRIGLQTHWRITEAAQEWDRHMRDPGYLYRDTPLRRAQTWARAHAGDLSPLERAFLQSSLAAQRRRRIPLVVAGFAALALVAVVLYLLLTESGPFLPGITWEPVAKFEGQEITAMAWGPDNAVYVAGLARGKSSLSRTTDAGATWQDVALPETSQNVRALLLDPRDARSIYASILRFGLYRSRDAGASWEALAAPLEPVDHLAMGADGVLFAGSFDQPGVYASEDGGTTWAPVADCPDAETNYLGWKEDRLLIGTGNGLWSWTRSRGCAPIVDGLGPVYAAVSADDITAGSDQGLYYLPAGVSPIHVLDSRITAMAVLPGASPLYLAGTATGAVLRWHGAEARQRRIPFSGQVGNAEFVGVINVQRDPAIRYWAGTDRGLYLGKDEPWPSRLLSRNEP